MFVMFFSSRCTPCIFALLVAACGTRPFDFDADTTSTGTSTSGATSTTQSPTSSTTDATGTSGPPGTAGSEGTGAASTGLQFVHEFDQLLSDCDTWEEDCPEGQKCMPVSLDGDPTWESQRCVPLARDPGQIGAPCTNLGTGVDGLDTCGEHMMCWLIDPDTGVGTCTGMCTGTPEAPGCADPDAFCVLPAEGVINLCLPTCDPLADDCPSKHLCAPVLDTFACILDAGVHAPVFAPCEFLNDCAPGLACAGPDLAGECEGAPTGCCLPYCALSQPNTCPGQGLACLPWFSEGTAPPKYADLGICGLPKP